MAEQFDSIFKKGASKSMMRAHPKVPTKAKINLIFGSGVSDESSEATINITTGH
jgi:hypothetical protein